MYGADAPHTVEYQIYRGEATDSSYWGLVMPGLGTPKVKIQVIDLEHLIDSMRMPDYRFQPSCRNGLGGGGSKRRRSKRRRGKRRRGGALTTVQL